MVDGRHVGNIEEGVVYNHDKGNIYTVARCHVTDTPTFGVPLCAYTFA